MNKFTFVCLFCYLMLFSHALCEVTAQEQELDIELPVVVLSSSEISYGVYDPHRDFDNVDAITIEQVFLPLRLEDSTEITLAIETIRSHHRFPLIALETWPWNEWGMTQETLLVDLANGWYDTSIVVACQAIAAQSPQEVWIRLDHEMDLLDLFPWSQGNPARYIAAFRQFVTVCREQAENVSFMWSPAGDSRAMEYYPGDGYVDMIGLTVLGYEVWDREYGSGRSVQSFNQLFQQKWNLIDEVDKPVVIAEFGVCCEPAHQEAWLQDAYGSFSFYENLTAVVYFQEINPANAWSLGLTPDWRVDVSIFPPTSE